MWYPSALNEHKSLGSQSERPGSLGNLAAKRKETLSQFFTPLWVVKKVYAALESCTTDSPRLISMLDNSCGSGRWFAYADPEKHALRGVDIEETAISALDKHVDEAQFDYDFVNASMVDVKIDKMDIGLINPPFSINLQSPFIKHENGVTSYGTFGPDTSAVSHAFALIQALRACTVVVALIPRSLTNTIIENEIPKAKKHLTHVYTLPNDIFEEEGVKSVACDLCIFDTHQTTKNFKTLPLDESLSLEKITVKFGWHRPNIINRNVDIKKPIVTMPVTGNNKVTIRRKNRYIDLSFSCGLMQAKVMNSIYRSRLQSSSNHRYPATTHYRGQHILDLFVMAYQENPFLALDKLLIKIGSLGADIDLKPCVKAGLLSIVKTEKQQSANFSHTVYQQTITPLTATAKRFGMLGKSPANGVVKIGDIVTAQRTDTGFIVTLENGKSNELEHDQFLTLFSLSNQDAAESNWVMKHDLLSKSFPQAFNQLDVKAKKLGLDKWLSFEDYQYTDLLELCFKPKGAVVGWEMGLGKARLAIAICMMGGKHNLLMVKSRLVDEMQKELSGLGLDKSVFKIIESAKDCDNLAKINVISYDRAKGVLKNCKKQSIAKLLRNRIHTVCADEGGILSNFDSIQSRAVRQLSPVKRYVFDGTPIANYVRNVLPIAQWTCGHSRPSQPYSISGEYLYPGLIEGARYQRRGIAAFADDYVVTAWATNEFAENLVSGAKREVPKINDVTRFREWVGCFIKRRVQQEPDVMKYVNFPIPTMNDPIVVDWDYDHLTHYIGVVQWFTTWFANQRKLAGIKGKNVSLAAILAKLDAAFKAVQRPEDMGTYPHNYYGKNSKDDAAIELIESEVEKGNRPILYARNPMVLHRLSKKLNDMGISNLVFTGQENIKARTKKLDDEFRNGNKQVLLASIGAAQDGLNIYQANSVIFFNRDFQSRAEYQAIARVIRPQQDKEVNVFYLHMAGSLDIYQAQMVDWKHQSCMSGLDYGTFDPEQDDFIHYDTFFERFINSTDELIALRDSIRIAA